VGVWRWLPTAVSYDPEKELFPGVLPVVLMAVAIAHSLRHRGATRRWVGLYALTGVVAATLSLGPHVRIWGHLLTTHGPYGWLLRLLPGMDGMRVPARFAIIAFLALSVLAAAGAAVFLVRRPARTRAAWTAACVLILLSESWAVPLAVYPYHPNGRPVDRAVAEWLRAGTPGAVLHLPIGSSNFQELNFQYATLLHRHHCTRYCGMPEGRSTTTSGSRRSSACSDPSRLATSSSIGTITAWRSCREASTR
jgi:hypothetical protein